MNKTGVLLVNLGTPDSPKERDVKKYLIEFLTDGRVINLPWLRRNLLVRRVIVPKRFKESAQNYLRIWTDRGSPLKIYGERVKTLLQDTLGDDFLVALAMRYQSPSIEQGLNSLKQCKQLVIIPLFPQYASATTGSVHQKVMEVVSQWITIPELHFVNSYPLQESMIEAFCQNGRKFESERYDHVVFSFHGLPEKQIRQANDSCLKNRECCHRLCEKNQHCYAAQCHATARAIAKRLAIDPLRYTIAFQSRLGNDPWLQPYTSDTLDQLVNKRDKRVLVFCPAFVCDCLETIDEIGREYRDTFLQNGGEALDLVPSLNDHPLWIEALKTMTLKSIGKDVQEFAPQASNVDTLEHCLR